MRDRKAAVARVGEAEDPIAVQIEDRPRVATIHRLAPQGLRGAVSCTTMPTPASSHKDCQFG